NDQALVEEKVREFDAGVRISRRTITQIENDPLRALLLQIRKSRRRLFYLLLAERRNLDVSDLFRQKLRFNRRQFHDSPRQRDLLRFRLMAQNRQFNGGSRFAL